ncbi:uncharacterized protein G6M90_00g103640 [Metarhizium brunneum]|uniref:Uncharacterized protein n=1 Tax=Metarhizium brunneum TaxID=500148 RepID=A0A7D5ZBG9_9HYPO|nr:hypothetical protein G6M90_00g103640 [Metarhizium brunneum]
MERVEFRHFQEFVANLDEYGVFREWDYQTLRSQLAIDLATCETENCGASASVAADALAKFPARNYESSMGPDYEYSIRDGAVYVNRFSLSWINNGPVLV